MENTKKHQLAAQDYFDRHPQSNECHISHDGRVFHTVGAAQSYASGLKNASIESYDRPAEIVAADDTDVTDETGTDATGTDATGTDATGTDATGTDATGTDATGTDATGTDATGTDATGTDATGTDATGTDAAVEDPKVTALKNFDHAAEGAYEAGKALLKLIGVKPATNSKVDVFAAIAAEQKKLQA